MVLGGHLGVWTNRVYVETFGPQRCSTTPHTRQDAYRGPPHRAQSIPSA